MILIIIWILCGLIGFRASYRYHKYEYRSLFGIEDILFSMYVGICGPMGLVVIGILTRFKHWRRK